MSYCQESYARDDGSLTYCVLTKGHRSPHADAYGNHWLDDDEDDPT